MKSWIFQLLMVLVLCVFTLTPLLLILSGVADNRQAIEMLLTENRRLIRENRGFACSISIPVDVRTTEDVIHCFKINGAEPPALP